ncbi:hypothetical protein [Caudoviricetes sp.]|nr:hypothetical protein [Caudoviricetes sp.]
MKKPTKRILQAMSGMVLLNKFAHYSNLFREYHCAVLILPPESSSQAMSARSHAADMMNIYHVEILRRMGGAK